MPRFDRRHAMGRGRRRHRGRGIMDWLGGVNNFLKDSKIISGIGSMLPGVGGMIGSAAGALGYGRRRRIGRGLSIAGGSRHYKGHGLGLAGAGRHHGGYSKVGY